MAVGGLHPKVSQRQLVCKLRRWDQDLLEVIEGPCVCPAAPRIDRLVKVPEGGNNHITTKENRVGVKVALLLSNDADS